MRILILTIAACCVGCCDPDSPVDSTGHTSIVIQLENGDWCELRGPARFTVLDGFAPPDSSAE